MRMKGENAGRCLAQHLATNCGGGGGEGRSQEVGRSVWVLAVSGRKEKSWSLKGKGPGQKRSSKAILAPHTEIDIVL